MYKIHSFISFANNIIYIRSNIIIIPFPSTYINNYVTQLNHFSHSLHILVTSSLGSKKKKKKRKETTTKIDSEIRFTTTSKTSVSHSYKHCAPPCSSFLHPFSRVYISPALPPNEIPRRRTMYEPVKNSPVPRRAVNP